MTDLTQRYQQVKHDIQQAALMAGRAPDSVHLLAVSKAFAAEDVEALFHAGQRSFGENYVQEAVAKIQALKSLQPSIQWHLIGPLQSNKTAIVAEHFDWVQTVDRLKIAQRLSEQRPAHLPPLHVCIQVNLDGGHNKSGIDCMSVNFDTGAGLQALQTLACQIGLLPRLTLRGLLAIPEPYHDFAAQQMAFTRVKALFDWLNQQLHTNHPMDTLSMGMSADFPAAIASGSTLVRVGSAIFGQRAPPLWPKGQSHL